jgi:hypothetical protein
MFYRLSIACLETGGTIYTYTWHFQPPHLIGYETNIHTTHFFGGALFVFTTVFGGSVFNAQQLPFTLLKCLRTQQRYGSLRYRRQLVLDRSTRVIHRQLALFIQPTGVSQIINIGLYFFRMDV